MGEVSDDRGGSEELAAGWHGLTEAAARHPGMEQVTDGLRRPGPPTGPVPDVPVIVDTDIGGDPDDAFAVAVAARSLPQLALVATADEVDGERARFGRWFLDSLGRPEVPVVAGASLGNTRYFCVEGMTPGDVRVPPVDLVSAVAAVCEATTGPVRWVGMGPMSNLAAVLDARPELASRLLVTQMGAALRYRDPQRAEHNVRLDPAAVRRVLATPVEIRFITSDVTFTPELEITAESPIYRRLREATAPVWVTILADHLDRWFARFHPGTIQHDPLTLSAAMELPFVSFTGERVAFDDIGRMRLEPEGRCVLLSQRARYEAFLGWFGRQLAIPPAAASRPPAPPRTRPGAG